MSTETADVLIIGAGPAGIAAAVQLRRYGLSLALLEREAVGGLLRNAGLVENYPGFPDGIPGPSLAALFENHLQRFGVRVTFDEVLRLDYEDGWRVGTTQAEYRPEVVIVASGTKPKPVPVPVPEGAQERVFSEVRPLADVRGKAVAIVGAGDAAFDYALNLAGRGNAVTILNRGCEASCLPLLRERASAKPNISYRDRISLRRVEVDAPRGGLKLVADRFSLSADYLLFAVGRRPRLDFLADNVKRQARRLVRSGRLYFVGDVHNGRFRQAAIAAGEGLRAALRTCARRGAS
ncbi:MAG: NAD(P)/FAD-dependent oxidoreductase [Candidatus Aminicenantes bacterium]|nr:NAD(P)/FAD-dependent oxidoreductase [Candidatus Aminicenantes bacterium]